MSAVNPPKNLRNTTSPTMDLSNKPESPHKTRTSHVRRWVFQCLCFVILGLPPECETTNSIWDQIWPTTVIPFGLQTIRTSCLYILVDGFKAFARRFHSLGLFKSLPECRIRILLFFSLYLLLGFQLKWYRLQSVHGAEDCYG